MASKLQVTASKLQVTASKLQVTASKLQVTASKLQVTPTKLQVTRSKLTSLTAETNITICKQPFGANFFTRCLAAKTCTFGRRNMYVWQAKHALLKV